MADVLKRLLVVEDDLNTRDLLKRTLINANYDVTAVSDGPEALRYIERYGLPHLVLLDLGLPTMHGFEVSKHIKRMGDVPIVFLTGDDDEESIVTGIQKYAEDYLVKPFSPRELVVRIRRILSRLGDLSYADSPVKIIDSHITIDPSHNRIINENMTLELTPVEARILWLLVNNPGRVVRTEQLLERVWPGEEMPEETLRVNISRLRRKFHHSGEPHEYFQNERGLGYKFSPPETTG